MGWQMAAGTYSSGITVEKRVTWRTGMYSNVRKERYYDVGQNLRRWNNIVT